ncbi:hypothetical protein DL768_010217 [Monosporascus sp. mg162]|nr:hypothetical protein DL768_010217 [Monosporascus sp. mg162]
MRFIDQSNRRPSRHMGPYGKDYNSIPQFARQAKAEKYLSYLEVLRSGQEVIGDILDTDVPVPPGHYGDIRITLREYLVQEFFILVLDAGLYDPAKIVLSFKNPEDALFKPPRKTLVDDRQTACFFKRCGSAVRSGSNSTPTKGSPRPSSVYKGRSRSPRPPPASVRQRWASQLDTALAELHKAGVVRGDVRAENVLIDQDDNARITDFGGGSTQVWVDEQMVGTVEGDLAGMVKLREFIFQDEAQDRWWTG